MLPYNSWIIQIDMFTMDMCNGHFNNRFIDLQMLGQNGRVESISTVSVIYPKMVPGSYPGISIVS